MKKFLLTLAVLIICLIPCTARALDAWDGIGEVSANPGDTVELSDAKGGTMKIASGIVTITGNIPSATDGITLEISQGAEVV